MCQNPKLVNTFVSDTKTNNPIEHQQQQKDKAIANSPQYKQNDEKQINHSKQEICVKSCDGSCQEGQLTQSCIQGDKQKNHQFYQKNQNDGLQKSAISQNQSIRKQVQQKQKTKANSNKQIQQNNTSSCKINEQTSKERQLISNNQSIKQDLVPKISQNIKALPIQGFRPFRAGEMITNPKKNICYKVLQLIGSGTFGQVLSVASGTINSGMPVFRHKMAMKVVKNQPAYIHQGLIQIKNLRQIAKYQQKLQELFAQQYEQQNNGKKYPYNYLRLFDGFKWEGHLCIAMELMDNSIYNILQTNNYKGLEMKWIQKWTKQILFSLAKMHKIGIFHCDIKPENIMFRPQQPQNPILIDFSSSCQQNTQLFTYIQSRFYRSPQVLLGLKPYTQKIDIWSLGCVLAEIYLGLPLFPGGSAFDQIHKICHILNIGKSNKNAKNNIDQLQQTTQSIAQMIKLSQFGEKYFNITQLKQEQTINQQKTQDCNNQNDNMQKQSQPQCDQYQQIFSQRRNKYKQCHKSTTHYQILLKSKKQYQRQCLQQVQINPQYFNIVNIQQIVEVRNPPKKDMQVHQLFVDLLKKMLVFNPEHRISTQEAFLHPFISGTFRQLQPLRSLQDILQEEKSQANDTRQGQ